MNKSNFLILIIFCFYSSSSIAQISESEVLPEGILFARYPDSVKPANPVEGLCIYNTDLKTLECYDGTEWKSFCDCDDNPPTSSNNVVFNCPPSSFVLDECLLTVNWAHDNPLSTTVNYDIRINGVDEGPSVTYPTLSKTIDIC